MKKSLLALAVLGAFAGSAVAQSSVTLYGVADASLSYSRAELANGTKQSLFAVGSGGLNGSRFGLRGTEDLGGGLKAKFTLESGFNIDAGTSAQGGRLFGRAAWVGFESGFGEIRIGRHLTPIGIVADNLNSMGTGVVDLFAVAGTLAANGAFRTDNSINYLTPSLGGLTAHVQYATRLDGAEANKPNDKQLRHAGFNVRYAGGPITAQVGYLNVTDLNATAAGDQKADAIAASFGWNFGFMSVLVAGNQDNIRPVSGAYEKPTTYGLDLGFPIGPVQLNVGLGESKDTTGAVNVVDDTQFFNVKAVYNLSKRTALYTFFGLTTNDAGANKGYNSPAAGKDSSTIQMGVRHFF
jgi:predicted porin